MSNNTILKLSWALDIPDYPVFPRFESWGNGPCFNFGVDLIQVDPEDWIKINMPSSGKKKLLATKLIWEHTIDRYLLLYYDIARNVHGDERCYADFPSEIDGKVKAIMSRPIKARKNISVPFDGVVSLREIKKLPDASSQNKKLAGISASKTTSYTYEVPCFTQSAYLNLLYKDIATKADANSQRLSLFFNGLPFRSSEVALHFELEDYIYHEWLTGISLSIEITAILLRFQNIQLRDLAFDDFCKEVLPKVALSPYIYTRIAVARHYFLQVLLDANRLKYVWNSNGINGLEGEAKERFFMLPRLHAGILSLEYEVPNICEGEQEEAMAHLLKLLSDVVVPLNLPTYVNSPLYGLAAFCHPRHKNVNYFTNKLSEEQSTMTDKLPRDRGNKEMLFKMVHEAVLKAIHPEIPEILI